VCCIAFALVAAFLLLDLDEKLFSGKTELGSTSYAETPKPIEITGPSDTTGEIESQSSKPVVQTPSKQNLAAQAQKGAKSRLSELESRQFRLELSGDARISSSNMGKNTNLIILMNPVKGTGLSEFRVVELRFFLDGSGLPLHDTGVKISGKDITIGLVSQKGQYQIHGLLEKNLLDTTNDKQNVLLSDQKMYFTKKDIPYILNLKGNLSS
jgi:hypothetical protein